MATLMRNALGRYKNQYTAPTYTEKVGDAVASVGGWHGSSGNKWIISCEGYGDTYTNNPTYLGRACLIRSYSGSIFSYYGYGTSLLNAANDGPESREAAHHTKGYASRAVVVVGSGV